MSDTAAAARAFEALGPAVLGYLRAGGSADPEGLSGDVFLSVTAGIDRVRGDDDAVRRWVFTIAHHRLVDERRRASRRRGSVAAGSVAVAAGPAEPFDADLVRALNALTADQREVLALRFVADLSLDTVAAITRRRVGAVKALQARGLTQLARRLTAANRTNPSLRPR